MGTSDGKSAEDRDTFARFSLALVIGQLHAVIAVIGAAHGTLRAVSSKSGVGLDQLETELLGLDQHCQRVLERVQREVLGE